MRDTPLLAVLEAGHVTGRPKVSEEARKIIISRLESRSLAWSDDSQPGSDGSWNPCDVLNAAQTINDTQIMGMVYYYMCITVPIFWVKKLPPAQLMILYAGLVRLARKWDNISCWLCGRDIRRRFDPDSSSYDRWLALIHSSISSSYTSIYDIAERYQTIINVTSDVGLKEKFQSQLMEFNDGLYEYFVPKSIRKEFQG